MGGKVLTEAAGVGMKFNGCEVLAWAGKTKRNHRLWRCRCYCGNAFDAEMWDLTSGKVKSCGCLKRTVLAAASLKHGGCSEDAEPDMKRAFQIWAGMRARCRRESCRAFKYYGGRGIGVHTRWDNFENFVADMGLPPPGASIERVDNDGWYEPGNCVWLPRKEQARNRRDSIRVSVRGEVMCLRQACRMLAAPYVLTFKRWRYQGMALGPLLGLADNEWEIIYDGAERRNHVGNQ